MRKAWKQFLLQLLAVLLWGGGWGGTVRCDAIYFSRYDGPWGNVYQLDPATGATSLLVSGSGPSGNGIDYPIALALGPDQNLYVGNANNDNIVRVTPQGATSYYASHLNADTWGLTFDPSGNLYAAQIALGVIVKISPNGAVGQFASGLAKPAALCADPAGDVYVVLANSNIIDKITPAGAVSVFTTAAPSGIAWAANGDLYASAGPTITKTTLGGDTSTLTSALTAAIPFGVGAAGDLYVYDTMGLYATGGGTFYDVTPSGAIRPIADVPFALDFVVVAPEPSSGASALAVVGLAFSVVRRRRAVRL